jgi:hypothetical protein
MHHSATADHARHDTTRIAAHAAGDIPAKDAAAAALLSGCSTCAELHRDLIAISAATRALPRAARAPRDFRLSEAQAQRLHRVSWLRSLLRPLAASPSATRSVASTLTAAGVAGLLIASLAPALLGGAASTPTGDKVATGQSAGTPAAPEVAGPGASAGAAAGADATTDAIRAAGGPGRSAASTGDTTFSWDGRSGASVAPGNEVALGAGTPDTANFGGAGGAGGDQTTGGTAATITNPWRLEPVVIGSIALLAAGIALFGLGLAARRLR